MFAETLRGLTAGFITLSQEQLCALERHFDLLVRWNRVLNLTSVSADEAAERHYGESLFLASHLPLGVLSVLDLGSGAGFPGFPVAVVRRECRVTLVESHQRKAVFLRESSRGVPNVRVLCSRAEAVSGRFDWVVSRAVDLSEMGPLLERLGRNVAVLGGEEPPIRTFEWQKAVRVPWGVRRWLWMSRGSEMTVSRETLTEIS